MAKTAPIIRENTLTYQHEEHDQVLLVETPAWYDWLESASTFAFTGKAGTFTARKERSGNRRGGWYWKAYLKQHGKLCSRYLGKTETLTLARLRTVAQTLAAAALAETTAASATELRSYPGSPLLATKLYRPMPRPQLTARLAGGPRESRSGARLVYENSIAGVASGPVQRRRKFLC